jgi:CorA-like Mg2+ transporter protein
MLPLALVAGYFGMNFDNLPGLRTDWGWVAVTGGLVAIAAVSLGVFIKLEWIRRPSGRKEGMTLGRALTEAARAPTQVAGAAFEISTLPLRTTTGRVSRRPMDAQEMDPQGQDTGMR